jgi:hypothetical protein
MCAHQPTKCVGKLARVCLDQLVAQIEERIQLEWRIRVQLVRPLEVLRPITSDVRLELIAVLLGAIQERHASGGEGLVYRGDRSIVAVPPRIFSHVMLDAVSGRGASHKSGYVGWLGALRRRRRQGRHLRHKNSSFVSFDEKSNFKNSLERLFHSCAI